MSIIAAGTSSGTALISTGNTDGTLVIQTNGTTVAATFGTDQKLTLAGALVTTGVSTFAAGSAAAPSITTTGDTNTGVFFSAADTIDFTEGGAATGQFDSSGNFKFNSGYGSVATAFGCRAWVNFNGTGTVAIRASGNVSSITDNGTGNYTVNFTNALADGNYAVATGGCYTDNTTSERNFLVVTETLTTTSFRVFGTDPTSGTALDYAIISCNVFR